MDNKIHHALSRARELIDTPEKWIQGECCLMLMSHVVDLYNHGSVYVLFGRGNRKSNSRHLAKALRLYKDCRDWIRHTMLTENN